jgi:hypothetical protein
LYAGNPAAVARQQACKKSSTFLHASSHPAGDGLCAANDWETGITQRKAENKHVGGVMLLVQSSLWWAALSTAARRKADHNAKVLQQRHAACLVVHAAPESGMPQHD